MQIFIDNKDFIYFHRENAYKIMSHRLKVSIETIRKVVDEIKELYLEYQLAKECKNGFVIDMSEAIYS